MDEDSRKRINGVTIALKDTPFASNDYGGTRFGQLNDAGKHERIEMIPSTPKRGRYVKVWIPGTGKILQLCEVEVFRAQGRIFQNI